MIDKQSLYGDLLHYFIQKEYELTQMDVDHPAYTTQKAIDYSYGYCNYRNNPKFNLKVKKQASEIMTILEEYL